MVNNIFSEKIIKHEQNRDKDDSRVPLCDRAKKWFAIFFASMIALTILSNIADSLTVPKVKVSKAGRASLHFMINGNGKITAESNEYIKIQKNIRISNVYVKSGDKVKSGDILFQYDLDEVKGLYEEKQADLRKAQIEADKMLYEKEMIKDEINVYSYEVNDLRGMEDFQKSKDELESAKSQYEQAYIKAVEKAEKLASEDIRGKQEAYDDAEKKYHDMKISNKEEILKGERDVEDAQDKLKVVKKYLKKDSDDDSDNIYRKTDVEEAEKNLERAEEDLKNIKKKCRYNMDNIETKLEKAKNSLEEAGQEPYDYETELSGAVEKINTANKNLSDSMRKSEDAKILLEDMQKKKMIDDNNNNIQNKIDNSNIELKDIEINMMNKDVKKIKEIIEAEGKVIAAADGVINKMELEEGKTASGEELVSISCNKFCIKGIISNEDAKKIGTGDDIYIMINEKADPVKSEISSIDSSKDDENIEITAALPEGNYTADADTPFKISKDSKKYDKCIPIEAIRSDRQGKYILALAEKKTVLGEEEVAQRIDIDIIDRNYLDAAISGDVTDEHNIIIDSSRNIESGDRVRVSDDE